MARIPSKVATRIKAELKRYQKVLESALARDVNESDTVIIVSDILSDVLGYDKYADLTTEFAIRSTFCDLAVKIGDKIHFLIEVKAIGLDLKSDHLRQAVNYAANQGVNWVILTNGKEWHVYRLLFQKPIKEEKVFQFNLLDISSRDSQDMETLYVLSKEGISKAAIEEYRKMMEATNRFTIAALIQSEIVISVLRREIRKMHKGVRVDADTILELLQNEVLKRDVVQGEEAQEAMKKIKTKMTWAAKKKTVTKNVRPSDESVIAGDADVSK